MVIVTWVGKVWDVGRGEAVVGGGIRGIAFRCSRRQAASKDVLVVGEEPGNCYSIILTIQRFPKRLVCGCENFLPTLA